MSVGVALALYMLSFLALFILGTIVVYYLMDWQAHIKETKRDVQNYGYAGYRSFNREFESTEFQLYIHECLSNKEESTRLVGNRYIFNTKGMIMRDPISFIITQLKIHYKVKELKRASHGKNTVKW